MAAAKKRSLQAEAAEQWDGGNDAEWEAWLNHIRFLRESRAKVKKRFIVSSFEKNGAELTVKRRAGDPKRVAAFVKVDIKKSGRKLLPEIEVLNEMWVNTVGAEIGEASSVFSYKNGTLTIVVYSAPLLQEIRLFHQQAINKDLRDNWPFPSPLVQVKYRLGHK